jgi:hypothetical protein
MRHKAARILVLGATLSMVQAVRAEDPKANHRLIARAGWLRFDVVMGRLAISETRAAQNRHRLVTTDPDGTTETLAVAIRAGRMAVRYSYTGQREQMLIDLVSNQHIEIRRTRVVDDSDEELVFRQRADEPLTLLVQQADGTRQQVTAPSLWHLLLAHQQLGEDHLLPTLLLLNPDWQISRQSALLRQRLFQAARQGEYLSRAEVDTLVTELRSADFQTRRRAYRRLRSLGPAVISYLTSYTETELDREQRRRLDCLVEGLHQHDPDTPSRVAKRLSHDPAAWLALLKDPSAQQRALARTQLARICDRRIEFDPEGPDRQRAAQIASLMGQLLR